MDKMKNLLSQLKVAKKYNNKKRVISLILEIARYEEPKSQVNPENTQIATTAKYYADVFGYLLNAVNKEIAKAEKEVTEVSPAKEKAVTLANEIFMACTSSQKSAIARKLGLWGSQKQLSWVVDILRRNIFWVTNALEKNLLPKDVHYFIAHHRDLSQQVLLDPAVEF